MAVRRVRGHACGSSLVVPHLDCAQVLPRTATTLDQGYPQDPAQLDDLDRRVCPFPFFPFPFPFSVSPIRALISPPPRFTQLPLR
jgi:hypothetical protein